MSNPLKPIRALVIIGMCALAPTLSADERHGDIPDLAHRAPGESPPMWIASSLVVDEEGNLLLDRDSFSNTFIRKVEWLLEEGPGFEDCIEMPLPAEVTTSRSFDLERAVDSSKVILVGEVTARRDGFYWGIPGTVVQIRHVEQLRSAPERNEAAHSFAFFANGEIELGPRTLCVKNEEYADTPEVGDRIVAFVRGRFGPDDQFLWTFYAGGLATLHRDGTLSLPEAQRRSTDGVEPRSASSYIDHIRRLVREKDHGQ